MIYRFNIVTRQRTLAANEHDVNVLSRVPGADAVFVLSMDGRLVTALGLDGNGISQSVKVAAGGIPVTTCKGAICGRSMGQGKASSCSHTRSAPEGLQACLNIANW